MALLAATGGHWALLQSFAWTTMLAGHWQKESLTSAVEQTFGGRHPCKLCLAIAAAKKAEKKTEFPGANQKLEFPPLAANPALFAPGEFSWLTPGNIFPSSASFAPPTPPPRSPAV